MDNVLNFARDQNLEQVLTVQVVLGLFASVGTPTPPYTLPFILFGFYALSQKENPESLKHFVSLSALSMVADILYWLVNGSPFFLAAVAGFIVFCLKPLAIITALETIRARGDRSFRPNLGGWGVGDRAASLFNADASYESVPEVHVDTHSQPPAHSPAPTSPHYPVQSETDQKTASPAAAALSAIQGFSDPRDPSLIPDEDEDEDEDGDEGETLSAPHPPYSERKPTQQRGGYEEF